MQTKKCKDCNQDLSIDNFQSYVHRIGKRYYKPRCKRCDYLSRKEYLYDYKAKLKLNLLNLLSNNKLQCLSCGITNLDWLEIDHVVAIAESNDKRVDFTMLWALLKSTPSKIKDYQVLCRPCNLQKEVDRLREIMLNDQSS